LSKVNGTAGGACTRPTPASSFLTTDPEIWVYLEMSGVQTGDALQIRWTNPSGSVVFADAFNPASQAGNFCYADYLTTASDPYTPVAGQWNVSGYWDGASTPVFSISFLINPPSGGGVSVNLQTVLQQLNLQPGTYTSPTVLASQGLTIVANSSGTPGAAGTGTLQIGAVSPNEVQPTGTGTDAFFNGPGIGYGVLNCTTLAWTGSGSLTGFTITRPGMINNASIPAWAMYAYDSSGNQLATTGEGNLTTGGFLMPTSYASFTVSSATAIARVVFCSHNSLGTYNALPLSGGAGGGGSSGTSVTVTTNPAGLSVAVDGTSFTSPQVFTWSASGSHTLSVSSPQTLSGTTYTFASWSDGGAQTHTVTTPSAATTYTANFNASGGGSQSLTGTWQMTASGCGFLGGPTTWQATMALTEAASGALSGSILSETPNLNATILPNAEGNANNSPTPPVSQLSGSSFGLVVYPSGWISVLFLTGTVSGSQITGRVIHYGSDDCSSFTMVPAGGGSSGTPITVTTNPPGLSVTVDGTSFTSPQVFTWSAGGSHTLSVSSPQTLSGTSYAFASWSDGGAQTHTVTAPSAATTYTAAFTASGGSGSGGTQITGQVIHYNYGTSSSDGCPNFTMVPPSGSGGQTLTGTWQLTATGCGGWANSDGSWTATMALTEAANGVLSGSILTSSPSLSSPTILPDAQGNANSSPTPPTSLHSGSNFGLVVHPGGWVSVLFLTGTVGAGGGGSGTTAGSLLQNGNAEAGPAGGWNLLSNIPAWSGQAAVVAYADGIDGLTATAPGPSNRGNNYFAGGPGCSDKTLTQTMSLPSTAYSAIDAGTQPYTLDGWLGGLSTYDDSAKVDVAFLNASGVAQGNGNTIGPVLFAERSSVTGNSGSSLIEKTATGNLPPGTRSVLATLTLHCTYGDNNDGVADNLSFGLTSGTGSGGGGTSSCAYNPQQPDPTAPIRVGAAGSSDAFIMVSTTQACSWVVSKDQSWITINYPLAPYQGSGPVTVLYSVAPNPAGSPARTGHITFAYPSASPTGSIVYTISQDAGTACTYSLPVTSGPTPPIPASGGPGYSFAVQANPASCQWTAAPADAASAAWITVRSPIGATNGPGNVTYDVAAYNPATPSAGPRTGRITAAGQTYTVNQAAPAATGPAVSSGGITNAASYAAGDSSGPGVAQGSYISIFGSGLGPNPWVKANSLPFGTSLGGVTIKITNGAAQVNVIPTFVSSSQINAIVPSNAPLGAGQLTVTYNGVAGAPAAIKIVPNAFGAFSLGAGSQAGIIQNANPGAADQPINSAQFPAIPGTTVAILWGTGVGPNLSSTGAILPDNTAPAGGSLAQEQGGPFSVSVTLAGKDIGSSNVLYAGRSPGFPAIDVVYFKVPSNAATGCAVPVVVTVGGVAGNTVTMAVDPSGKTCTGTSSSGGGGSGGGGSGGFTNNPGNPFGILLGAGNTKLGMALVVHANVTNAPLLGNMIMDFAEAGFVQLNTNATPSPVITGLPNLGSCTSMNLALSGDLSSATSGMAGLIITAGSVTYLNAGQTLTLYKGTKSGSTDTRAKYQLALDPTQPTNLTYSYAGGSFQDNPAFVTADQYELDGTGGSGVGAFSAPFDATGYLNFASNAATYSTIDRSQPLHITWTGGDPTTQAVMIAGGDTDPNDSTLTDGFVCLAPMAGGSFDVPVQSLAAAPVSTASLFGPSGKLMVIAQAYGSFPTFTATGLDKAVVAFATMDVNFVSFK
jgi:uncharacterized protein (TIGR03437 family)